MTTEQRNAAAREFADRDPVAIADFALKSDMVSDRLQEWFDATEPVPVWREDEGFLVWAERVRADADRRRKAETERTSEWHALQVNHLLLRWDLSKRPQSELRRWLPRYAQIDPNSPKVLVDHLAKLPEAPDSTSGISLLSKSIETMPVKAEWNQRQHANLPTPLANTRHIVRSAERNNDQLDLPFDHHQLPRSTAPSATDPRFEVGYLPGLEPAASKLVPFPLLDLFGAAPARGGRGPVPVWGRMGWEALLAPEPEDYDGRTADLKTSYENMSRLVSPSTKYIPSRHGPQLREGARMLNDPDNAIEWRACADDSPILLVMVYMPPAEPYDRHKQMGFYVTRPGGSRQGPQVNRVLLRYLRAKGWRLHRIMLAAYCLWDRYATVKGRLIALTLPAKVRTDAAGYSISATGRLLLDSKGRPTRRTTHPKAVQIGTESVQRPDLEQYYPWLEGKDLLLLGNRTVGDTPAARRKQRWQVMNSLTALREAGCLDFETRYRDVRGGRELGAVRLLPSDNHRKVHAARWAAKKHGR